MEPGSRLLRATGQGRAGRGREEGAAYGQEKFQVAPCQSTWGLWPCPQGPSRSITGFSKSDTPAVPTAQITCQARPPPWGSSQQPYKVATFMSVLWIRKWSPLEIDTAPNTQ